RLRCLLFPPGLHSIAYFFMTLSMYSAWGLFTFPSRSKIIASCSSSLGNVPAKQSCRTPAHAPRFPSQYSGSSGSKRSSTWKALAA
ncbi:hypothetical protein NGA_2063600, partial [Nannochloropsis gaditana CCMP526]|uniref:uncharacterized protein n=1 Tax=Nannochloropsis gaditana (strain CCMP526) TaxID=1093141 RepID=UPI00029F6A29